VYNDVSVDDKSRCLAMLYSTARMSVLAVQGSAHVSHITLLYAAAAGIVETTLADVKSNTETLYSSTP
jgi:hypothetical protein